MLSSKEALERLYDGFQYGMAGRSYYDLVLEDLERLEVVNKNFDKTLKTNVDLINKNLDLQTRLEALEKENEIIKQSYFEQGKAYNDLLESNELYLEENEKLKKAIEIIKTLPNCDMCDANWHKGCMCLQRKIKEVLENE